MYTLRSIFSSNVYNLRAGVTVLHRYSNGNTLENQNNFYLKNENDDNQRLKIQKINQSLFIIYEWKDQSNLSPNQSTYIKYFNEADPSSDTNSNEENSAPHNHSLMNRRSKMKTNRTRQQNDRNTWKPLLIVSIDNIVRQSVEEYLSSKRQYESRPTVQWPPMHPLLPFKNRRLDDDDIINKNK